MTLQDLKNLAREIQLERDRVLKIQGLHVTNSHIDWLSTLKYKVLELVDSFAKEQEKL